MRILVIGATGLIGSALCGRLAVEGHEVIGASRHPPVAGVGQVRHVALDLARAAPSDFIRLLGGVNAVVNCAGTLQDAPGDSTEGVHERGVATLIEACANRAVGKLIHLSAIGVQNRASSFSATKNAGDRHVIASGLDWVILRPSVVIGRAAYGGSALLRGLAALPLQPVISETGPVQLVWLDDVLQTILFLLRPDAPVHQIIDIVGPRRWTFIEAVRLLRRWMRWPEPAMLTVPTFVSSITYKLGDVLGAFGWRPPVRTTTRQEIANGAFGDPRRWTELTGIEPTDIEHALAREPASVQDRWFARLYLLKPLVFGLFGLFWLASGLISFGPGWDIGIDLVREGGLTDPLASAAVIAGAGADVLIGAAILYRPTSRYALYAAFFISVAYVISGSILVPRLWREPLGPLLKIWPILVLNLVAIAIREDR